ncbi:hypothetical protein LCGC14_0921610 [marine sediment metagenome]|uniref:Uncharacterized protein n=1 Tax=marine sediment metagenome TaxID=412755 RepID=A0A0F9NVG6_9ZZZZ
MGQFVTRDGRRISIFSPITQSELADIPNARDWAGRGDLIDDASYRELQTLVLDAFAVESDQYVLGFVSGFNGAVDRVREMTHKDLSYEQLWNNLMLLLSEAARYLPPDVADDEANYLKLPEPGSQDN